MKRTNRQVTLQSHPKGYPVESDFRIVETPVPEPAKGEFRVRVLYLSVDPYMRLLLNEGPGSGYFSSVKPGEAMPGGAVGVVEKSNHPDFREGDIVGGMFGWRECAVSDGKGVRKVDPSLGPLSTALGVLGMPGMTAYFGLLDIAHPKQGETVVVSGAAGAVGALVGQIAKIQGCRVVGIAGSDEKVRHIVKNLGFDAAFNYKTVEDYEAKLKELCPKGIDVYFDNVGGKITDAVFPLINEGARISVCGQISQYNLERPQRGPRWMWVLIGRRARVEGFMVYQFAERFGEGIRQMAEWMREGKIKYDETILDGIESAPRAFIGMLQGENVGKQLVRVSAE